MNEQNKIKYYTLGEEIANSITHGIGTGLSIAAMVLLIVRAVFHAPPGLTAPYVVGCTIFGVSLILLYTMSTLYHALTPQRAKHVFAILDHSAIYILIAGTYTGYCMTVLFGALGWTLFGIIWALAILGITIYAIFEKRAKWFGFVLYLVMGWMIILFAGELWKVLNPLSRNLLVYGGLTYTVGAVFFLLKNIKWMHSIWHLFVLGGSVLHFLSLYFAM